MKTGNTGRQNCRSILKKKEKSKVLIVKSTFWRIISPAFLALGLVQDSVSQMSAGLDDGYQAAVT